MATQHRATMGGQPTIPRFVGSLACTLVMIGAQPPAIQRQALIMLTESLAATALAMQAPFLVKPVV